MSLSTFEDLMEIFDQFDQGKQVPFEQTVTACQQFFKEMEVKIASASEEERQVIFSQVEQMQNRIAEVSKKLSEKAKMTEDDLERYSNNPKNFSKEHWTMIQDTRASMLTSSDKIAGALISREGAVPESERPTKALPKPSRTKKNWMKS